MSQNFVLPGSILVLSGLHDSCWRAPCKHKNEIFGGQNPQFFWPAGADVNADDADADDADADADADDADADDDDDDDDDDGHGDASCLRLRQQTGVFAAPE